MSASHLLTAKKPLAAPASQMEPAMWMDEPMRGPSPFSSESDAETSPASAR
eukprot:CAMPEP_0168476878 /NCGR_PEP_ID=MMETSP0228-20121227/62112_1 /TAXON_ID=133427 /ORGANISM="Protoceratium reticulatum, Strain CCCM 535 (=CCMP 1889)" /LENGTH=50 /DNA_ID=CAMNT_0008493007 /DNA_START=316 /DNA_END=464 /DNA_ORIENTATION=-